MSFLSGLKGATKGVTKFGDNLFKTVGEQTDTITKEAADKALKEAAEKAAQEAAKNAAKNVGDVAVDITAKNAYDITAKNKIDNLAKVDVNVDVDTEAVLKKAGVKGEEGLKKSKKIQDVIKRNPGKTLGAAAVVAFGATVFGLGMDRFAKNNNKPLGIIKMEDANRREGMENTMSGEQLIYSQPIYNQSTTYSQNYNLATSDNILITFTPSTDFSEGDKIEIGDTNMEPSFKGQQFDVTEIVSDTQIKVRIPGIKVYATSGTIIVKTTVENCLEQSSKDTTSTVVGGVTGIVTGATGGVLSELTKGLGGFKWIIVAIIACCCLGIIGFILMKFMK